MTRLAIPELDLRRLPPSDRPGSVLHSFDRLSPGESLELVAPDAAREVLERLQRERPWRFDWNVLELTPDSVRVALARRTRPGPPMIQSFLGSDTERLERLLDDAARGVAHRTGHPVERFHAFSEGLRRHVAVEEELVVPRVEANGAAPTASVLGVLFEHEAIERLLEETESRLEAHDADFVPLAERLGAFLEIHSASESSVLHAAADRLLPRRRAGLVRRMQSILGSPGDTLP